jgi:hypothetical protein
MAKAYGAADQIEDPSSLDAIVFRSYDVTIVYNLARDVFSFQAGLGPDAPRVNAPARVRATDVKRIAIRKLRLARPAGDEGRLYGEAPVAGLTYPEFSAAFDEFLEAVAMARAGQALAEERFAPPNYASDDDLVWIRP